MKKSGRRILIIVLSIMMIMTYMIPGSVFADTAGASEESATAEVHEHDQAIEELSEGDDGADATISNEEDPPEETEGEVIEEVPEATEAEEPAEEVTEEPAEETPAVEEPVTIKAAPKAADATADTPAVKAAGGLSVLAFTSDTHNKSGNVAANRLGAWLDKMASIYGAVDVMAFGGDMANASASESDFWTLTQADMDELDERDVLGVYTTGNHEYNPGSYTHGKNSTTQKYKEDQLGYEGSNYRIYCLGSAGSSWNAYSSGQITTLTNYLNSVDSSKPIIIITHYPLHYYGSRTISNASSIIDVLNTASDSGKKIVYLWGHNHTESDTNYDEIFEPGDKLSYSSGNSKEINFYYGGAGCMSDTEYGGGSGSVKGKGLIITINNKNQLSFAYHNADGNNVTENGSDGQGTAFTEQDPVYATSMSLSAQTATVEVGRTLKPKLEVSFQPEDTNFKAVTWTSSNPSVASVDSSGKVRGVSQGTATITAKYALEGSSLSASCTVTVVPRTTSDPEYVIRIGNYALSTEHSTDSYSSGSSYGWGGSTYNGMVAVPYTAGSGADDSIRWILEETDDGNGYYIKSSDDKYLNATYSGSSGWGSSTSDLKLDDTPDVWTFDGDLEDWLVDGSKLKSANTGRYLAEETGSAGTHLITLRSADNADTTIGELASDPVAVTGVSVTPATTSVKERETVQLTATVTPADATNKKVTWSSSNTAIATVDEKGLVKGVAEGSVTITATTVDGSFSAASTVTVIHNDNPSVEETISITPSTDNPEQSITINVGDTLVINTTNGSSNSGYNYTATLTNSSVAQIQGNSTINIAAGATGQFTVAGIADGTVDINIQNDQSSSQYVRKAVIHLTVGSGSTPVDPPTGDTVSITPSTDNPEQSIKINVGETLTINVTNGSSNSAYDFTATLANSSVAQIQGNSTVNIAAGATGQFTVKGIANGTVDITIQNSNTYGSQYTRKGIIHLTVGEGTTPIEPPVGDTVTYQQANTLEAGKDYIIVNGNSGSVYVLSTDANGSRTLKGIAATVSEGLITLSATDAAKAVFTAEDKGSAGGTTSVWLKNNSQYLYTDSSSGLRMVTSSTQGSSSNSSKVWHYKADDKNLLWFFNSNSNDGYTDTSSTYKYYLEVSNGNFTDNHADSTSLANTTTPKIYLFEKYEGPLEVTGVSLDKTALTLKVGQTGTLTATVVPSGATNKEVTWSSSNPSVATVDSNGKVTAVKAGTATITVTTVENNKTATCTVTVKEAGAGTDFVLTDKLEDGKDYLIANGNTGNVYIVSNEANGSRKLKAISVEVVGDTITIDDETADKAVFTAEGKTSTSGSDSAWLKNRSQYLYTNNADGLRVSSDQTATDNTGKYWHYKADGKNLLWYFKDTSSSDGYTDTSGTYKYYLEVSGSDFTDNHVSSTSLANSNTPKIYLFVKDDSTPQPHTHTYTGPVWTWASDNTTATATFTCSECGDVQTVAATVTQKTEADGSITYTATAAFEGKNYTDTKSSLHQHTLVKTDAKNATCTEAGNTAYWRCSGCGKYFGDAAGNNEILEGSWVIKALGHDLISHAAQEPTCTEIGWDAYYTCSRCDYTTYKAIPATGHDWNTPTYEWAADYKTATASRSCNNGSHPETETVNTTSQITTPATCETKGVTTYTATFTNAAFGTRTTTVENVDALGHKWAFVGFTWTGNDTDGYTAVTADYKCSRDESHTQSVAAELTNVASGASCTEPGTITYTASISADKALDGKAQSANKTVASAQLGHDWGEATYTWAADNSSVTATHVCKRDATHTESETVTTTSEVTSAPTCTAKGETVYTAVFTKEGFAQQTKTVETDMLAHTLTHHDAVAAQCEAAGNAEYWSCDVCNKLFSDAEGKTETTAQAVVVPATGHTPATDAGKAPTCEESGLTEGSHCAVCGKVLAAQEVVPALGHDWDVATYAWAADNSSVTATHVCKRDASHTESETVTATSEVTSAPTCTAKGETVYTADFTKEGFAQQIKTVETDMLAHTLTHHDAVAAQCEAAGNVEYWSCDVCKKLFSDAEGKNETTAQAVVIPASGHSPSTDAAKAPTCEESGLTEGSHCAICGKVLKAQEVVPALGHDWGEITYAWESDNSKVTATRVCSRDASHVDTETVNTTVEVIAEGSCTEDGETKYTATFQKEEFAVQTKTVITEATGHKWDAGKVTKEPTYRTDGEMTYTCTVCGETYTEPIPKQGWKRDSDNNWNYINPDGTKATGWKQVGDYWYYMDKAGIMQTGWTKVGNKWYYMNKNGAMQTGWQKIGGKWYYFASSGAMQTGWQEINGKTYYFKSSGVMADKEWVSGYWWINAGGTWTYKYRASWQKTSDGHWMFKATNGWTAKSVTYIINDVSYTFDANGYMI